MADDRSGDDIGGREKALRAWFTRDADTVLRRIDGLDIGWGRVQRWATARMPSITGGIHLDIACGYGTFLAQLGWRFPRARLVGLNIDFCGPHALARTLLIEAGVKADLVQADARLLPFPNGTFDSTSCFLGLQDIEIGFGEEGVQAALAEAVRVLRMGGKLTLLDDFRNERLAALLQRLPVHVLESTQRPLDVRWDGETARTAVRLYANGWVAQMRDPPRDAAAQRKALSEVLARMEADVNAQLCAQGYYVPFGPVRMVVAQKVD
jgi:ubiquinone/menaquinone biosynthesis C-methylase UbiE